MGGVAIYFREEKAKNCSLVHKDKEGKLIIVDFTHDSQTFRLFNIHAPYIETGKVFFTYSKVD